MLKTWIFLIGSALFLFLWETATHFSDSLLFVMPPPSRIALTLFDCRSRLLFHSLATLKEMAGGFALASAAAFPLAWMMMRFHTTRTMLQPFFIFLQCLPMFALAPIMILWFGWGYAAIIIPTALMIFFPLTLNIYQGLRSTPENLLELFRVNQATPWQVFYKLRLPWAAPHIFAGFRISSALAGIGAVAGEWAGAQEGLGIFMLESKRNADLELTFSALFCLTAMSMSLYALLLVVEKWSLVKFSLVNKRSIFSLLLCIFLLVGLTGCRPDKKPTTRLLLDWLPNPNHIPLYVGLEKGFFEDEGIFLLIQKMHESNGGITYLASGQADLLISDLQSALRFSTQGIPLKIVGTLIKEPLNALIYVKNDHIHSAQDLSGCVLGYCLGGPDMAFLTHLLEEGKIIPKEKRNVSVDILFPLMAHQVDCIYGGFWNIEPAHLHALGVETGFFKIQEFGIPSEYELILLALKHSPQADKTFICRLQKALQTSISYCKEHPDEAFQCYLQRNLDKREKTVAWEKEAWQLTYPLLVEEQTLDRQSIEKSYAWSLEHNLLKEPFNYQNLIP